jgi:beta-N-acetylhexosaminidase
VSQEQLDASVRRVLEAKAKFDVLYPKLIAEPDKAAESTATPQHRALALELAQKAITLLKDEASLLPLKPGERILVIETSAARGLGTLLNGTSLEIKNEPETEDLLLALSMVDGIDKIIVATTDASFYPGQVKLVTDLLTKHQNVIVVSVRTPYDIQVLPMVGTVFVAYGGNPPTLRAIADVLTGKAKATGVLPVALS